MCTMTKKVMSIKINRIYISILIFYGIFIVSIGYYNINKKVNYKPQRNNDSFELNQSKIMDNYAKEMYRRWKEQLKMQQDNTY